MFAGGYIISIGQFGLLRYTKDAAIAIGFVDKGGAKGQTLPCMLYCISLLHIQLYGNLVTKRLIVQAANSITVIPQTTPYNPNSHFPTATNTQRLINNPHTSAHSDCPYVAAMFRNIRRLGDMGKVVGYKFGITNSATTLISNHSFPPHTACQDNFQTHPLFIIFGKCHNSFGTISRIT